MEINRDKLTVNSTSHQSVVFSFTACDVFIILLFILYSILVDTWSRSFQRQSDWLVLTKQSLFLRRCFQYFNNQFVSCVHCNVKLQVNAKQLGGLTTATISSEVTFCYRQSLH